MEALTSKELLNYLLEGNTLSPERPDQFIRENPKEDLFLDYKNGIITSQLKRDEGRRAIREYVSGFANSDGGVLIIGVDESLPRRIAPCEERVGQSPLDQWASRCLHDMASYFSPQPRFQVINHPQGQALAIAVARGPSLVPCVESRELKYFLRVGDSTFPVPEYLITDLVLGRRQRPLLDVHMPLINESTHQFQSLSSDRDIPTRGAALSFVLENLSLLTAEDIKVDVVSWSLVDKNNVTQTINKHLRAYIDVRDTQADHPLGSELRVVHSATITAEKRIIIEPFQKLTIRKIGPFYFSQHVSAEILAAVYVIARDIQPIWFQLEFGLLEGGFPTKSIPKDFDPTLLRMEAERRQVAWLPE